MARDLEGYASAGGPGPSLAPPARSERILLDGVRCCRNGRSRYSILMRNSFTTSRPFSLDDDTAAYVTGPPCAPIARSSLTALGRTGGIVTRIVPVAPLPRNRSGPKPEPSRTALYFFPHSPHTIEYHTTDRPENGSFRPAHAVTVETTCKKHEEPRD
ncbi:hypothetical protein EVAR_32319_1 [Eumeta japonica]|uniref:Uncharacterized protein n=1 Tax=Eumeta variegata TaxID=151549 RepID=A0A4C1ZC07_EUMVA|nr:hypothetical protein EVAR_32319_1 [Eumeta japonica]